MVEVGWRRVIGSRSEFSQRYSYVVPQHTLEKENTTVVEGVV
jgi:hypothetical protein